MIVILAMLYGISASPTAVSGAEKGTPVQLALFHPVQLFGEEWSVYGIRVNAVYGFNRSVYGINAGMVNRAEDMYGMQAGICNIAQQNIGGKIGRAHV